MSFLIYATEDATEGPPPSSGVISPVGSAVGNDGANVSSLTLSMSPLATDVIMLGVTMYHFQGNPTVTSISDTKGATWTLAGTTDNGPALNTYLYLGAVATTGATTITLDLSTTAYVYAVAQEFASSGETTWTVNGVTTLVGTSSSAAFAGLYPFEAGEMWCGVVGPDANTTPPMGYTTENPTGTCALTFNAAVTDVPQMITVDVSPIGGFGSNWAAVAALISTSVPPDAPPTAPSGLDAIPGSAEVYLSWTAPANDNGSAVVSYNIYQGTVSGDETLLENTGSTATTAMVTSLTNATTYYFKVTAINGIGEGALSNEATTTPQTFAVPVNPDPNATGSLPTLPFPNAFSAQELPTNTPPWWSGGHAVAPNSTILVTNFVNQYTNQGLGEVFIFTLCRYVQTAANADQFGTVSVSITQTGGSYPVPLPSPNAQVPSGYLVTINTSDEPVTIWDQVGNLTSSQWANAVDSNQNPTRPPVCTTAQFINGNDTGYPGFGPGTLTSESTSSTACGLPFISSTITWAEYKYGITASDLFAIKHMLYCQVGNPVGYPVNPAPISDGVSGEPIAAGGIPEGTVFVFPPGVSNPGVAGFTSAGSNAPYLAAMVFNAIQNYGLLVGDSTANHGIAISCEDYRPWLAYDGAAFPFIYPPYWMADLETAPYSAGAFLGMPWSSMVALEPSTLLSPLMTDNNGTTTTALKATQGVNVTASTTTITLASATSTNDMIIINGMLGENGHNGATGNTILGLGATWVKVFENTVTWPTDGSTRVCFCYVGYGCLTGQTALATVFNAPGDLAISRWSRSSASNPILSSATPQISATMTGSYPTNSVTVTNASTQIIIGLGYVGYVDMTENAFGSVSELNYAGTSWSNGKFNRHITNGTNEINCVFQNWIVPTATGAVSATFKANGYNGWGGWATELLLLVP